LGTRVGIDGRHRFGNADAENATLMQSLTDDGIVDAQITCERMNGALGSLLDTRDGLLDFVDQRQDIACVTRIARWRAVGKDITRGGFRDDPRLTAELSRTIALAFDNRGNGRVVGIDHFKVTQFFALREVFGLPAYVLMMTHRGGEFLAKSPMLGLTQRRRGFQARLGLVAQSCDVLAYFKELLFGLANQLDEDFTLTPTAAAKATHHFGEVLFEAFNLLVESRAAVRA
jgi:hypothetical protein